MEVKVDCDHEAGEKCQSMLHQNAVNSSLNVHWQQHKNNQELYRNLPSVIETICVRRLGQLATLLVTMKRLLQKCCFGNPNVHGHHPNRGRPRITYSLCGKILLEQFGMIPGLSKLVSIITSPCPTIIVIIIIVDRNKTVKRRKKIFWRYYFVMIRS